MGHGVCTLCPKKTIPNIFDSNLKKDYQILIIFDTNILDTTGHEIIIQFPTSPKVCFCTTYKSRTNKIMNFFPRQCYYLINITHKNIFVHISVTLANILSNCPFLQLPTVKMFEMSAHYVNKGTKTLSPFVDSSVDNVLLETNADFSHFLNSSTFLNAIL